MVRIVSQPLELDASGSSAVARRGIDVRLAEIPRDRDAVFRLRHRALEGQAPIGTRLIETNGRMIDPEDAESSLLAAFDARGEALACIRLRPLDDDLARLRMPGLLDGLGERLKTAGNRSSISSDLILLPKADRHVQVRLVASMFSLAAKRHWAFDICTATDEEIPARRGLGYLETGIRVDQDPRSTPRHILYLAFPTDGRSSRSG